MFLGYWHCPRACIGEWQRLLTDIEYHVNALDFTLRPSRRINLHASLNLRDTKACTMIAMPEHGQADAMAELFQQAIQLQSCKLICSSRLPRTVKRNDLC